MSVARWVEIDPAAPATVGPIRGGVVASQTATAIPCAASPPPTTTPAPPVIGPVDRTPPRATLTAAKARVRGRAVTLRLRLRSSERGTVRVTVARVGRGSKLTLNRPWRSPVAVVAARTRWLVVTGRLGGGVAPRRLRVTLRVADRAATPAGSCGSLSLVRLPRPRSPSTPSPIARRRRKDQKGTDADPDDNDP